MTVRSVMFTTGLFTFKYGRCLEVDSWHLIKTGQQVFEDKTVIVYDKIHRDPGQVFVATVWIKSHGGSVKYCYGFKLHIFLHTCTGYSSGYV